MTAHDTYSHITSLLSPLNVALMGVSHNPEDLGSYVLRNIVYSGYKGDLYPIHPKIRELYGYDTYSSVMDVKDSIDIAIIASPLDMVVRDVQQCARSKVKNICIVTSGFAEIGNIGLILQKKVRKIASEANIRILGPGSVGFIIPQMHLNASIAPSLPVYGKTVFLSQSGAFINALVEYSKYYNLGFSEIIGLGNKSDLSEIDFLEYYNSIREDGQPTVIGSYLENIANGRRFLDIVPDLTKKIPFIILIPSSKEASEYSYEHSGSIMQRENIIHLALEQNGVIKASTQQELFDFLLGFSWQSPPRGNHIAIVSNAGGGLVVAIDQVFKQGLKLVRFSSDVKQFLTSEAHILQKQNGVVDLGGEASSLKYLQVLDAVLGDHDVNSVVVILSPQVMTQIEETAETIGKLARSHGKTVVVSFMGYGGVEIGIKALSKYFIPAFNSPERAIVVLSAMYKYYMWTQKGEHFISQYSSCKTLNDKKPVNVSDIIRNARIRKKIKIDNEQGRKILRAYDIPQKPIKKIKNLQDILSFVGDNGYPIAFTCQHDKREIILTDERSIHSLYKKHFSDYKKCREDRSIEHSVHSIFPSNRMFSISIVKDTYYEYLQRGWNIKELDKLSFGYYFVFEFGGYHNSKKIESLLPLHKKFLEDALLSSGIFMELGMKSGERVEKLRESILSLIKKLSCIPYDFEEIHGINAKCVIDENQCIILESEIFLDLMC